MYGLVYADHGLVWYIYIHVRKLIIVWLGMVCFGMVWSGIDTDLVVMVVWQAVVEGHWVHSDLCILQILHNSHMYVRKEVKFIRENQLPQVGFNPMTLCSLKTNALPTELLRQLS